MRAVITVKGADAVGIIAKVSSLLAQYNVNIVDISQTTAEGRFLMVMLVQMSGMTVTFAELSEMLSGLGSSINQRIMIRHEAVFDSMHRI